MASVPVVSHWNSYRKMNSIFVLVATLLVVANAWHYEEHKHHPRPYKFSYGVDDHHTHDHHQQHEESDGHIVKGSYSLKEADGTTRIVKYVAGPHSGFNAIVERVGHAQHPQHYGHYKHMEQEHHENHENHHGHAESYIGATHWGFNY